MFFAKPAKPPSPLKKALRAIQLGVALGVAAFVLTTLLSSQVAMRLSPNLKPSGAAILVLKVLYGNLGLLLVAPVLAFAAGLYFQGARSVIVTSMVLTLQVTSVMLTSVSWGFEYYASPLAMVVLVGGSLAGIALSLWAMGRGQRRASQPAAPIAQEPNLKAIDFQAIKAAEDAAASASATPPAPAPTDLLASPVASAADVPERGKPPSAS
ncbi:MAG: hypothetical protein HY901_17775 [Deltaproteobacteria bacterium]|nr:hypothetical protein [Deltaproteobacteria bacterium]